jgi:hypothetical protein
MRVPAGHGHVVVFCDHAPAHGVQAIRLLIKDFRTPSPTRAHQRSPSCAPDQLAEFLTLARRMADHGFAFLGQRLADDTVNGPILVAWDD